MPQPTTPTTPITFEAPTAAAMHQLGIRIAAQAHGGDVILLSGPLGAGKTTLAQGIGTGLNVNEPVVSPTFTIARELHGQFSDGTPATLIHVDAYRLSGLDEVDALDLDSSMERSVTLVEWGQGKAEGLA